MKMKSKSKCCDGQQKGARNGNRKVIVPIQFITNSANVAIEIEKAINKRVKLQKIKNEKVPIYPNQLIELIMG